MLDGMLDEMLNGIDHNLMSFLLNFEWLFLRFVILRTEAAIIFSHHIAQGGGWAKMGIFFVT